MVNVVPPLAWIDMPSEFDNKQINKKHIMFEKLRNNPLGHMGMLAATVCLCMGLFKFTQKDSRAQNFYMRGRIYGQAFALACFGIGMGADYYANLKKNVENLE